MVSCEGSRFHRRYYIIYVSAIKGAKGINIRRRFFLSNIPKWKLHPSHPLGFVAAILRGATFWDPGPSSFGSKSLNGPGAYDRAPAPFAKKHLKDKTEEEKLPVCWGWMLGSKSLAWTMPIFHVLWARTEQKLPGCSMYIYIYMLYVNINIYIHLCSVVFHVFRAILFVHWFD